MSAFFGFFYYNLTQFVKNLLQFQNQHQKRAWTRTFPPLLAQTFYHHVLPILSLVIFLCYVSKILASHILECSILALLSFPCLYIFIPVVLIYKPPLCDNVLLCSSTFLISSRNENNNKVGMFKEIYLLPTSRVSNFLSYSETR